MTDVSVPQTRLCSKCKTEYPATTEYFYRHGKGHRKDGLDSWCKSCKKACNDQYVPTPPPEDATRVCPVCKTEYPLSSDFFSRDLTKPAGLRYQCKKCVREYQRERRERSVKEPRVIKKRTSQYRDEKRQVSAIANKHRRKQREKLATINFKTSDWVRCLEYFNYCCAACGRQLVDLFGSYTAAADHWIPLEKGGSTSKFNIVPLCHSKQKGVKACNGAKHTKLPDQWLTENFGKAEAQEIKDRVSRYFAWLSEQDNNQ